MTIEYKDSKRITGLSSDVVQTTSFDFNFSSTPTGWTELDSNKMGITGGQFHAKSISDNSNDTVYVPVGDLGDDWIIRMKAQTVGFNNISSGGLLYIGLVESGDETDTWIDTNNLGIFIGERYGDGSNLGGRVVEGGSIISGGTTWGSSSTYIDMADNGSTVYLELKLVGGYSSGTFSATTYTDETYSTVYSGGNNGANTNSITVGNASPSNTSSDLTYLVFKNPTDGSTGSTSNYVEFNFDDLKIYKESSLTSKPTDVQDNSILVEKDTARRYWFDEAPVVTDDLTTDKGWVSNTSDWTYNATGDYIDFATIRRSTTAQQIYIDVQDSDYLGSGNNLSDSAWTANFKVKTGTSASGNAMIYLGFSNNLADSGTTQQSATMKMNMSSSEGSLSLSVSRGNFETSSSPVRENADIYSSGNIPYSTDFYMTMIRSGDVFTLKAYSDSARTTQVGVTATVTVTGISSLRYIKAFNDSEQNQSYTSTGVRLYDMEITNGADTWTMQPTKEDNFNSWVTSNSAKFVYNSGNNNIDILNSNAYDNIYYDLGSVSDTKWLCKFKVTLTTAGSQSLGLCYFYVGSTTGDANESNDGLGFYFYDNANNTTALADNGNRPDQTTVTANLGISPSTTTYYAEMKRTSATGFTVTLYSDSSYSTSLGTATLTISSGITGLQYFKIMGYTTSGGLVGTLDDFKFYNGVSSIN